MSKVYDLVGQPSYICLKRIHQQDIYVTLLCTFKYSKYQLISFTGRTIP